jgi:hypothetical protein
MQRFAVHGVPVGRIGRLFATVLECLNLPGTNYNGASLIDFHSLTESYQSNGMLFLV